jgi:hypothetical protein
VRPPILRIKKSRKKKNFQKLNEEKKKCEKHNQEEKLKSQILKNEIVQNEMKLIKSKQGKLLFQISAKVYLEESTQIDSIYKNETFNFGK